MRTHEELFIKEFTEYTRMGRATNHFTLDMLPIPDSIKSNWLKKDVAIVKGVTEKYFDNLNDREVFLVGRTTLKKRQVLSSGEFRKDSEGNDVVDHIAVPRECVAIASNCSIGLRRYTMEGDVKREHKVSQGYRYVDYMETKNGRLYIYIIPKEYVYRANMCALYLSMNRRRNFYRGYKVSLTNGHSVYVYVAPVTSNMGDCSIIAMKSSINFDKELHTLFQVYLVGGFMFDPKLTSIEKPHNNSRNLSFIEYPQTLMSDEYASTTVSMAKEKDIDMVKEFELTE